MTINIKDKKVVVRNLDKYEKSSCTYKKRYENYLEAKEYLKDSGEIKEKEVRMYQFRNIIVIYECFFCKGWHIGHSKNGGYI